jgi:hypothetical protein
MALDVVLYVLFRVNGLLTALALFAVVVLKGGWEAAAAGLAIAAGLACGLSFIALLVAQDRSSGPPRHTG